ncbi:MAG TPA: hypothetical protein VJ921_04820, partial [Vicinamibacteria bacterium]|nr:hypothetical protein [Vicinamibacteria bacterium]
MSLVVALLPGAPGYAALDLLGKPVWQRTLDAARGLGASKTLWLRENGKSVPEGIVAAHPREVSSSSDTVLLLSAELPCITSRSLKSLLKSGSSVPHALSEGTGRARALALRGSDVRAALEGSLAPRLLAPREKDELLLVDTADSWSKAVSILRRRKTEELLRSGVLVLDPASILVEP